MKTYLKNRFYLRGLSPLGILNTVTAFLFNRVLVKVSDENGNITKYIIGKGSDFPQSR